MTEISENIDKLQNKTGVKFQSVSWINRLTHWFRSLPGPVWIVYLVMLLVLGFLNVAVLWLAGVLPVGKIDLENATDALWVVFFLGFFDYLNISAKKALRKFKPLLPDDGAGYALLEKKFTKLPARLSWLVTMVAIILLSVSYFVLGEYDQLTSYSIVTAIYQIFFRLLAVASFLFLVIQSTRQIYLVSKLHQDVKKVNLYLLGPSHAFSILTSKMGMGLALIATFGVLQIVVLHVDPFFAIFHGVLLILALAAFILPLNGMRVKLHQEKNYLLEMNSLRIEQLVNKFNLQG